MRLTNLQRVYEAAEPFASVFLEVSRTDADGSRQVEMRWRALREQLESKGADKEVVAALEERLTSPTGHGGELARMVVASGEGRLLLDELLPAAGEGDAWFGRLPHLMPWVRARAQQVPYVLVMADHAGADMVCVDRSGAEVEELSSNGGHDVLHKVPGGGWSHRRYQSRVEDSWERNAAKVAEDLDSVVVRHAPELVFLVGEDHSRSAIRTHASARVAERLMELDHGSRSAPDSDQLVDEEIAAALDRHRRESTRRRREAFEEALGRDRAVANGFVAVVEALRAGALETLLLADDPTSTWTLFYGRDPLAIGRSAEEVTALGQGDVHEDRADEVMLRAVSALDAEVVLIDDNPEELKDGVGALLRFDTRPETPGSAT